MKHLSLQQLADTIKDSNYTFSLEIDKEDKQYFQIDDIISDIVHWNCGNYEYCLTTFINHFDKEGNYIDTYMITPEGKEIDDLKLYCNNWIEVFG